MTDIEPILERLGLNQYYDVFAAEGFDSWEIVLDIQESDLDYLNVKLGHRRRLQRAIAEHRGISQNRPLGSPIRDVTSVDPLRLDPTAHTGNSKDASASSSSTVTDQKRKYRRHPRPDEHAPEKPSSAYVLFSNKVREEIKSENLSFTEIARLVGERWQKLEPSRKAIFDSHASALKDSYNAQLLEYKKTDTFKEYTQYLADFKAKHGNSGISESKRPRLEQQYSSSLSGASVGGEAMEGPTQTSGHTRAGSLSASSIASQPGRMGDASSANMQGVTAPQTTSMPRRHRGSPASNVSRNRGLPREASGQSSTSDGSMGSRIDPSDAFSLAAALSSGNSSMGTPPPSATGSRAGGSELTYTPTTPHWPYRPGTFNQPLSGVSGTVAANTLPALCASGPKQELWRDRDNDTLRRFHTGTNLQHLQQPGSLPISQLVVPVHSQDTTSTSTQRTLPPLQKSSSTPTNAVYPSSSTPSTSTTMQQFNPSFEAMAIGKGQSRPLPNPLESEAADTLTALAEKHQTYDSARTSRGWSYQPR